MNQKAVTRRRKRGRGTLLLSAVALLAVCGLWKSATLGLTVAGAIAAG